MSVECFGQKDSTTISLDLLRGPSSPAANLIGISQKDIEKPSDVGSFLVTLQKASGDYSKLPANFAVDLAPFWLFKRKSITFDNYIKDDVGENIKQSLVFSVAFKNNAKSAANSNSLDSTHLGLGFKFSIFRGKLSNKSQKQLAKVNLGLRNLNLKMEPDFDVFLDSLKSRARKKYPEYVKNEKVMVELVSQRLTIEFKNAKTYIDSINNVCKKEFEDKDSTIFKAELDAISKATSEVRFQRVGFKLDFAGGLVQGFEGENYDKVTTIKKALWVVGGWDLECGLSALGILRYQHNPDKIFADDKGVLKDVKNVETLDYGGSIQFNQEDSKFILSTEYIYRSVLGNSIVPSSYRFTINASYEIAKNSALTFSFGRNYDKTTEKGGNLIAAINFIQGFGNIVKTNFEIL
jgi:hypothetical protein